MLQTPQEYANLPEVTLSALKETGQADSTIVVLKQRSYTGKKPVITSALANTSCADLGVDGVLEKLNTRLGTSYTLNTPFECDVLQLSPITTPRSDTGSLGPAPLHLILEPYVARNDDFGTAYAHLRPQWYDHTTIQRCNETEDREMRLNAVINGTMVKAYTPPRRLWDLYANRVVPWWVADNDSRGISHAWVNDKDLKGEMTPINGYQWPVPMPRDADLNLIRIEMLNLGAEYIWLDALCLRQKGGRGEHLRAEEWKLDVPTIGWIYFGHYVVYYLSGLGRPLRFKPGDFESDRCWFRRVWTLQEFSTEVFLSSESSGLDLSQQETIGGQTDDHGIMGEEERRSLNEELRSLMQMRKSHSLWDTLSLMQRRVSTNPVDKIAGMMFPLRTEYAPIYDEMQSEEDAWISFTYAMDRSLLSHLFFDFPEPGNGSKYWRPSWKQVMTHTLPSHHLNLWPIGIIRLIEGTESESYCGPCIESGYVQGLADVSFDGSIRQGELVVKDASGSTHTFKIVAEHQYPVPHASYTLIGSGGYDYIPKELEPYVMKYWVLGTMRQNGQFQKFSVFRMLDDEEKMRLRELGVAKSDVRTFLC